MWAGALYKKLLLTETFTWWGLRKSPGFLWLSGERVRPCKLSLHMKGLMSSCKKEGKAALWLFILFHPHSAGSVEEERLMSGLICSPLNSRQRFFTYLWSSWLLLEQPPSSSPSGIPLKPDQFTI